MFPRIRSCILNPARYFRGIFGVIMKAAFGSFHNHARYIYNVSLDSSQFPRARVRSYI